MFGDKVKGAENINGPGLHEDDKDNIRMLKEKAEKFTVKAYETDAFSANNAIVHGAFTLYHPNKPIYKDVAYLEENSINPMYPHKLDSFFASISQRLRSTSDKFKKRGYGFLDSVSNGVIGSIGYATAGAGYVANVVKNIFK